MTSLASMSRCRPPHKRSGGPGLRLLHVARAVRTKGLRDASARWHSCRDLPGVTLTQAGTVKSSTLPAGSKEARRRFRVNFLGRIPRQQVEELYATSDAFLFPSFREPSGSVVFEAMRHGLPVIAADRGGPGHVVDAQSGIKVPVTPGAAGAGPGHAIRHLSNQPEERARLSAGAREGVPSNSDHGPPR
jgi:glycosyltransferase involved in cell wall biosynthesis